MRMYLCPYDTSWLLAQQCCPTPKGDSKAEIDLRNVLLILWEQHIVWTRFTIISIIKNLLDIDVVTKPLLRNPIDFKSVLKPYYGDEIATEFSELFKSHLSITAELVKNAKAGKDEECTDAEKRWYANADEIAVFLSSINPYWCEESWKTTLYEHLTLTKSEAMNILTNNYAESITEYDEIENQAIKMAELMWSGMAKQFFY